MAEDDARVDDAGGHLAFAAECLDTVDGVERHPAQDEEQHDDGEILRSLHLFAARLRQYVHAGRCTVAVVETRRLGHRHHLT